MQRKLEQARKGKIKNAAVKVLELEEELTVPEFPKELSYLWRVHQRLRRRKGDGFSSIAPIEWPDIEAFVRLTKFALAPWEIEILEALDDALRQPSYVASRKPSAPATELVDASDTKSVRNLMRSIGRRRVEKIKGGVPSQT